MFQPHLITHYQLRFGFAHKYPFFVGGTGLYINTFFFGLSDIPDVDVQVREKLLGEVEERGLSNLYEELLTVDGMFAKKVHPNVNPPPWIMKLLITL